MGAGSDLDIYSDVLVLVRRDRLLRRAAGRDRCESGDGNRDALAEPRYS